MLYKKSQKSFASLLPNGQVWLEQGTILQLFIRQSVRPRLQLFIQVKVLYLNPTVLCSQHTDSTCIHPDIVFNLVCTENVTGVQFVRRGTLACLYCVVKRYECQVVGVELARLVVNPGACKHVSLHCNDNRVDVDKEFRLMVDWAWLLWHLLRHVLYKGWEWSEKEQFYGLKIDGLGLGSTTRWEADVVSDQGVLDGFLDENVAKVVPRAVEWVFLSWR